MPRKFKPDRDSARPRPGQIRCHCGRPAILRSMDGLTRFPKPGAMAYVCCNYPACNSFVKAHPGTLKPMGTLAGPELRQLRYEAHLQFDRLFQSGLMTKDEAYDWLSYIIQAPKSRAHIGYLGEYYCEVVIRESAKLLTEHMEREQERQVCVGGEQYAGAHK